MLACASPSIESCNSALENEPKGGPARMQSDGQLPPAGNSSQCLAN